MKVVRPLSLALALFASGAPLSAAQHDQHKAHHPAGSAASAGSASTATAKALPGKTAPEMALMANHMKAMQEMHDRMMAAKTPEERNALMGEHMKTMQEGMGMMKGMGGMGGMGGMASPKGPPTNMAERQTMMEQRMDMMQTMMEMMVDRLPQTPAKP